MHMQIRPLGWGVAGEMAQRYFDKTVPKTVLVGNLSLSGNLTSTGTAGM